MCLASNYIAWADYCRSDPVVFLFLHPRLSTILGLWVATALPLPFFTSQKDAPQPEYNTQIVYLLPTLLIKISGRSTCFSVKGVTLCLTGWICKKIKTNSHYLWIINAPEMLRFRLFRHLSIFNFQGEVFPTTSLANNYDYKRFSVFYPRCFFHL